MVEEASQELSKLFDADGKFFDLGWFFSFFRHFCLNGVCNFAIDEDVFILCVLVARLGDADGIERDSFY